MKAQFYFFCFLLVSFMPRDMYAQSCTRYTVYKEDFGGNATSPNVGPKLPDNVTDYQYSTDNKLTDNHYGIRKQVNGYASWHSMTTDHTGGGYMMLINASIQPGLFYQKTIKGLCQGTSFQFSVWVANLMKKGASGERDPSLRFVIKDPNTQKVIADTATGVLRRYDQPTWREFGIGFKLPAGLSSVILQIYNNGKGGNGNDLVLDDISFSICGPALTASVSGMFQNSDDVCQGTKVKLKANLPQDSYNHPEFQWQFSSDKEQWDDILSGNKATLTLDKIKRADSGWYRILASEKGNIDKKKCRISSTPQPINVWEDPTPNIVSNSPVCEGDNLHLGLADKKDLTIQWKTPRGQSIDGSSPVLSKVAPNQSGSYKVKVTNPGGCTVTKAKQIEVKKNNLKIAFDPLDSILCKGDQRTLDASNNGASYLWSTGESTPSITVDTGGWYKVQVKRGVCSVDDSIHLKNLESPKIGFSTDTTICVGEPDKLKVAFSGPHASFLWSDGSRDSVLTVTQAGRYSVTVENHCGSAMSSTLINLMDCADRLLFPTAFTPNEDGQNDEFRPKVFFSIRHYHLAIFDRWGHKVFQSDNPAIGWNGTYRGERSPVGTYVWKSSYERVANGERKKQKGTITLIR